MSLGMAPETLGQWSRRARSSTLSDIAPSGAQVSVTGSDHDRAFFWWFAAHDATAILNQNPDSTVFPFNCGALSPFSRSMKL